MKAPDAISTIAIIITASLCGLLIGVALVSVYLDRALSEDGLSAFTTIAYGLNNVLVMFVTTVLNSHQKNKTES